jgi:dihydropteroate synthase
MHWQTTRFHIDLTRPWVMGIVNLTPDSFSDGGQHAHVSHALHHAQQMLRDGAGILDVGAESTRPGAQAVPLEDELARLMPFLREAVRWEVPISVDTYKPEVMQAVLDLGVDIVNDIWALRQPGAERVVVTHPSCGVCLMHMHRDPQNMQLETMSGDVVSVVRLFLQARMQCLLAQGVDAARLVLDPGIGFGKTAEQSIELIKHIDSLTEIAHRLGAKMMVGHSRKSFLEKFTDKISENRDFETAIFTSFLATQKVDYVRVHNVPLNHNASLIGGLSLT